ncbi:MAG: glycerate kinase [candidate division KSB1 bacterium]|nr:glycerate kinase [candidate division KSB1 bacterium]MDZ7304232.1 glycerate kinase [candidate division KSB1 bacterium]MDZ7311707.1 glycerate kinase [candidate division KSB1 bacterium]
MPHQVLRKLRNDAISIFKAGVRAVEPAAAVHRHVHREGNLLLVAGRKYDLSNFNNIFVVGAGKAACPMAAALEKIFPDRLINGQINVKYGHRWPLNKIQVQEAGHPVPDAAGMEGTRKILDLLTTAQKDDLVICVLSGGGSALMPMPGAGISLEDKQATTRLLLACGAKINEINTVRKHLSQVKGGQLARAAYPATLITLILSDVIGDSLEVIASGPTVPDSSTFKDVQALLDKYGVHSAQMPFRWINGSPLSLPASVKRHIEKGLAKEVPETPKMGDPIFAKTQNLIVANNRQAIEAANTEAQRLGYHTLILSTMIEGETREVARVHAAMAKEIRISGHPVPPPACVISGGETTVTLRGNGLGGRNQEFVLAAVIDIAGLEKTVILSAGTDGSDGPTDAAGAIGDGDTVGRAATLGMNPEAFLANNDSHRFFEKLGDLLITGPTNTNVMDLRLMLVG